MNQIKGIVYSEHSHRGHWYQLMKLEDGHYRWAVSKQKESPKFFIPGQKTRDLMKKAEEAIDFYLDKM
jgi:hypothetical protein